MMIKRQGERGERKGMETSEGNAFGTRGKKNEATLSFLKYIMQMSEYNTQGEREKLPGNRITNRKKMETMAIYS